MTIMIIERNQPLLSEYLSSKAIFYGFIMKYGHKLNPLILQIWTIFKFLENTTHNLYLASILLPAIYFGHLKIMPGPASDF